MDCGPPVLVEPARRLRAPAGIRRLLAKNVVA